jgi:hypothetical protein
MAIAKNAATIGAGILLKADLLKTGSVITNLPCT